MPPASDAMPASALLQFSLHVSLLLACSSARLERMLSGPGDGRERAGVGEKARRTMSSSLKKVGGRAIAPPLPSCSALRLPRV